jgi:hypothetical protein
MGSLTDEHFSEESKLLKLNFSVQNALKTLDLPQTTRNSDFWFLMIGARPKPRANNQPHEKGNPEPDQ